jgi:hypothetical protein
MPRPVVEGFKVAFDERPWVVVFDDTQGKDRITQYVPQGSTSENWTEMITERSFPGLQATATPEQEMAAARKLAEEQCSKVDWAVVGQEPGSVRYVATFGGCEETRPPNEVGRFIMSDLAIYQVTYRSKKAELSGAEKKSWADILARAHYEDVVGEER